MGTPNEAALLELMRRTGYPMLQENGQRKYGPPPGWTDVPPPRGSEIFVGKIPRDCYEDELVPVFERCGKIYEFRLMMDFSGSNRGYCFVTYTCRDDARRAVAELNNYEIRRGRFLGVCMSVDNCRLFVGGIPKNKQQEEILEEMKKVTEGVTNVIVYPSPTDKSQNRGFAFVEYSSHRAAAMARRKLIPGRIQLWGHQIAVDWAEPEQDVDDDVMSKVRILYVRNLMMSTPEVELERIFNSAAGHAGAVEKVKKLRDYAFIHFYDRNDALKAMDVLHRRLNPGLCMLLERYGSNIDGSKVEVVLAKPVDKNSYMRYTRNTGKVIPAITTNSQHQLDSSSYSSMTSSGCSSLEQQLQYLTLAQQQQNSYQQLAAARTSLSVDDFFSRNPGGQVPMMMSAGRVPLCGRSLSPIPITGSNSDTTSRSTTDFGPPGSGFPRARTYRRAAEVSDHMHEILPNMPLSSVYDAQQRIPRANPIQLLEEICSLYGCGKPEYKLLTATSADGSGDMQHFAYEVHIPGLIADKEVVCLAPKLTTSAELAKIIAAEHALQELTQASYQSQAALAIAQQQQQRQITPGSSSLPLQSLYSLP